MKTVVLTIGFIGLFFASIFALNAFGLFSLKFWGVKYQNARTEIFQETKAYTHGTIRDIENLCLDALKTESQSHRDVIRATINHRISAFNKELPLNVKKCLSQL